ncbi:MAG: type II secretion system F family protein [Candidatus Diapherotrites archaeon]|nr:type II secretion system F family protein [Candidatus Diapherotrites archaeon]
MYFYKKIGKILPGNIVMAFKQQFNYTGFQADEEIFTGFLTLFSIVLGLIIAVIAVLVFDFDLLFLPIFFAVFAGFIFAVPYFWLDSAAEANGKFVENILPDALQLISSNMKSGMTTERALFVSARPEYGILERELKKATQKILAGQRVEQALLELPKQIKSKVLEKTVWLISKGINSGGQMSDLLLQLSNNLRQQRGIQEEITANISMYVLLIFFGSAFGGPFLLGISTFIVEILSVQTVGISEGVDMTALNSGPVASIAGGGGGIDPGFVLFFSYIVVFVSALFASMTIGVINSGKEKAGIKYFVPVLVVSLLVFIFVRELFRFFFGGLLST